MDNQTNTQANAPVVQNSEKGKVTYNVAGNDVTLSYQIVRDFLVKGNNQVNDQDLVQFISICKFNQLNPFLNEAYLVKYGTSPAQMIVSKEALMKRADACPNYEGIQAGIIVVHENQIVELEGCFYQDGDKLVGGWAKVYRKDRKFPIVAKVNLAEYNKKQSLWNEKPSTMISKIAKVQALREAFPAQLGAMYTQEESLSVRDAEYEDVTEKVNTEKRDNANKTIIGFDPGHPDGSKEATVVVDKETGEIKKQQNPGF
ncbi:MAG: phage recombination protein Bet [Alphaproteobacteria bacterium]|nr:phage recombination protein Bet [Alphaproteobacteria bacterium]